jgi:acetyl esterase/lipase
VAGEAFAAALAAAGVPTEAVTEPGTEHGHLNRPHEPAASATVDRVVRWLDGIETQTTLRTTEGITP